MAHAQLQLWLATAAAGRHALHAAGLPSSPRQRVVGPEKAQRVQVHKVVRGQQRRHQGLLRAAEQSLQEVQHLHGRGRGVLLSVKCSAMTHLCWQALRTQGTRHKALLQHVQQVQHVLEAAHKKECTRG